MVLVYHTTGCLSRDLLKIFFIYFRIIVNSQDAQRLREVFVQPANYAKLGSPQPPASRACIGLSVGVRILLLTLLADNMDNRLCIFSQIQKGGMYFGKKIFFDRQNGLLWTKFP